MMLSRFSCLVAVSGLFTGCVTEPGPEDATVFGHVSKPKKGKVKVVMVDSSQPQPILGVVPELAH